LTYCGVILSFSEQRSIYAAAYFRSEAVHVECADLFHPNPVAELMGETLFAQSTDDGLSDLLNMNTSRVVDNCPRSVRLDTKAVGLDCDLGKEPICGFRLVKFRVSSDEQPALGKSTGIAIVTTNMIAYPNRLRDDSAHTVPIQECRLNVSK